ncbi:lysylphosphatidylglycerol synthase transmembrane domain-containing protein [Arcticibacter eurypsychrophilus]|uniref:lysylphosphatidylglycerol synthase transmembrane domain-containing protein n=1 Tax=Arcticibacter eurypsychrophilus TaxID=1434752 RepID=UPI00084DBC44|nr:lysylphosphatidylglycerol synthase transmembrane domain-containing protein [Arcticibacter eurypsychrophilus]
MKFIKVLILICVIVSLIIFVYAIDYRYVISSIQKIGFKFIYLIAITGIAYVLGTLSWKYCMAEQAVDISLVKLFLIRHVGETASLLNPAGILVGETVKAHLLQEHGIEKKAILSSILVSRVIMIVTQLILFSFALSVLLFKSSTIISSPIHLEFTFTTIAILFLIVVSLFVFRRRLKILMLRTRFGLTVYERTIKIRLKILELKQDIANLFEDNKKTLVLAIFFALLHWIAGCIEFYLILQFLGVNIHIVQALLVDMGVIFFKAAGVFIPGQVGIEEFGNKIMLAAVGITGVEIWTTASILRRSRQLTWIGIGFIIYWFMYRIRISNLKTLNGNSVY